MSSRLFVVGNDFLMDRSVAKLAGRCVPLAVESAAAERRQDPRKDKTGSGTGSPTLDSTRLPTYSQQLLCTGRTCTGYTRSLRVCARAPRPVRSLVDSRCIESRIVATLCCSAAHPAARSAIETEGPTGYTCMNAARTFD